MGVEGRLLAPHGRTSEMAARWSSENVVVEFRDSQVRCVRMVPSEHALSVVYTPTPTPRLFIYAFAQGGKMDMVLTWSCQSQDSLDKL